MRKSKFCFLILIIFALIILSGCREQDNLEVQKGLSEVRFLENQCISIFNKYMLDDYLLENSGIDWDLVNEDFNVLSNSTDVVLIDFTDIQIPSENILELENYFRDLYTFIQNKDMDKFIKKICDSYSLISYSILENISNDEEFKLEKKVKSRLLYIGYYLMNSSKEDAITSLDDFQREYSELSSNKEYIENNSYKINKIFVETQKLKTEINKEDFDRSKDILLDIFEFF